MLFLVETQNYHELTSTLINLVVCTINTAYVLTANFCYVNFLQDHYYKYTYIYPFSGKQPTIKSWHTYMKGYSSLPKENELSFRLNYKTMILDHCEEVQEINRDSCIQLIMF